MYRFLGVFEFYICVIFGVRCLILYEWIIILSDAFYSKCLNVELTCILN